MVACLGACTEVTASVDPVGRPDDPVVSLVSGPTIRRGPVALRRGPGMSASIGRTDRRIRPLITRPAASPVAAAGLIVALAILGAGCIGPSAGATGGPLVISAQSAVPGSESPAATTAAPATAAATPSAEASLPTTTQTAWGRIWDDLPAGFPAYPGAQPADVGQEPASAVLVAPAGVAKVAAWYRQALVAAGYSIEALAGPMEDGSTVIDAVGQDPACRVQASIGPRGSQTTVSILFAAACPFR